MNNSSIIKMPNRFDYSSSAEFNGAIRQILDGGGIITLDCSGLEYIDSAGIGLLVMAQKKALAGGSKIVMINLKSAPKEILQLANLQKIIEII